jgi:glyceraldehyde 3-phosphate dehydrogenase
MSKIKVGINGLGRIGRVVLRRLWQDCGDNVSVIRANDINPDVKNIAYLLQYDSLYGRFKGDVTPLTENDDNAGSSDQIQLSNATRSTVIGVSHEAGIGNVDWSECDYVVECSGYSDNAIKARELITRGVKAVFVANTLYDADFTITFGVNEGKLDVHRHKVISTAICDSTGIAPVLAAISERYEVEHCFITTMHPWLSYQNLLDGFLRSQSNFNSIYEGCYELGRSSVNNLIPKTTTTGEVVEYLVPRLKNKITAYSQRIPTSVVVASDISLVLKEAVTSDDIVCALETRSNSIIKICNERLVSGDFQGETASVVVDKRWLDVKDGRFVKLLLWYDNEYGYAGRVADSIMLYESKRRD